MKNKIFEIIDNLKNIFRYAMFNYKGSITPDELNHYISEYEKKLFAFLKTNPDKKYSFLSSTIKPINNYFNQKDYFNLAKYSNEIYHKLSELKKTKIKENDFIIFSKDKTEKNNNHQKNISVNIVLDNIRSPFNVGAFFRIADAIGNANIYLCGISPTPENNKVKRTAMNTDNHIKWNYEKYTLKLIKSLKQTATKIVSVETTSNSQDYNSVDYSEISNITFVFGNEEFGIEYPVLRISDYIISIPMYGIKNSLNVSVSAGIILFNYIN
jgi:23S rRNA (guanosine2251-2'-O)-methyltransferase